VLDLHSEKLHRDFHNMPSVTAETSTTKPSSETNSQTTTTIINSTQTIEHVPRSLTEKIIQIINITSPPESAFIKLAPGSDRYSFKTIKNDEL
jgi:hypothetical protein